MCLQHQAYFTLTFLFLFISDALKCDSPCRWQCYNFYDHRPTHQMNSSSLKGVSTRTFLSDGPQHGSSYKWEWGVII